jgi:hypothetical protein
MKRRIAIAALGLATLGPIAILAFQARVSQQYEWEMQDPVDDPPDARVKAEFAFGRLRYRSGFGGGGFGGGGFGRRGGFGGRSSWGIDANRADRAFAIAMRRLTRVDTRSVEEVIDVDNGPLLDYPWIYAVEVGRWGVSADQGKRIREYLERGGFLMVDDFHGGYEWDAFMEGLRAIYPDKQVVDIPDDDPIFHMIGDLSQREQIPGYQYIRSGSTSERPDGAPAHWRGIYDDRGRLTVAICHNMDLGDAWQYADEPRYPERFAAQALRIGVSYVMYAMTH